MIITRSPLRITLGGGGTDLPSYYTKFGGFVISAAIDKYVYIDVHKRFTGNYALRYSKFEEVDSLEEIKHPIIRESLRLLSVMDSNLEISSMADIPAGTGLGSSSSFTVALLKALYAYKREIVEPKALAEKACQVEIDILQAPIGKQDQYISSYGGLANFEFQKNGRIDYWPLAVRDSTIEELEDNLLLFFTGYARSASDILLEQDTKSRRNDQTMIDNLHRVKELGFKSKDALEKGNLIEFGRTMHMHWLNKKKRGQEISNPKIDYWYALAMQNGAVGGKVLGAGGGGFLMFYAEDKKLLRQTMQEEGLREVRFKFDFEGAQLLVGE